MWPKPVAIAVLRYLVSADVSDERLIIGSLLDIFF
jgi:hypothetical protein